MLTTLLLLSAGLAAQRNACPSCADTGRVACAQHRSSDLARESNAILCSFYADCEKCAGTGNVDCPRCEVVPGADAHASLRLAAAERFAAYASSIGRPVLAAASAHFNLVCELEPMKVEARKRGRHELLHLELDRLEAAYRAYLETFALTDADITARSEIFLWSSSADHQKAGQAFCGYTTPDVEYKRGVAAISSIWLDPGKMEDDEALHRNLVHHVVHGLMNAQPPVAWTGKLNMGWADEGLSLWFEDRLLGAATGFCFWPEAPPAALREGNLRPAVRKLLAPDQRLDFERLLTLDTVVMTREEHALGFALIDYLAVRDPALLKRLLERMRARTPSRDAIKEVYGLTLVELEGAWRAWVAETYSR